jgi:uncharacterized membrane protein HdeD (DUF308 family)
MAVLNSEERALGSGAGELWWLWVIQAILAIVFGFLAVLWPGLTLTVFVYLIGVYVLVIGLTEVVRGLMNIRTNDSWWLTLVLGLLLSGAGVYLSRHPHVSFKTFIVVVGVTFLVWGAMNVVRVFFEGQRASQRVLDLIAGVAGLAVGVYTLVQPVSGGLAFVWAFGIYALVYGIMSLVRAIEHHREYRGLRAV